MMMIYSHTETHIRSLAHRVREASISLMDGESIFDFTRGLSTSAQGYIREVLGVDEDYDDENFAWVWTADMFADSVVIEVEWRDIMGCVYYSVGWSRGDGGDFVFGPPVEVERTVNYVPVAQPMGGSVTRAQVDDPTDAQRANLPPEAYAAPFFANDDGDYDPDGEHQPSKSKLPHHINTVTDPDSDGTVDVPRLRNALARFNQVDWSGFGDMASEMEERARDHIDMHAKSIGIGGEDEEEAEEDDDCDGCDEQEEAGGESSAASALPRVPSASETISAFIAASLAAMDRKPEAATLLVRAESLAKMLGSAPRDALDRIERLRVAASRLVKQGARVRRAHP